MPRTFPPHFTWGAATASYQIEGGAQEGGRKKSTWDAFCQEEGKVFNGDSGAVACDHFHRWREDISLMKELNLGAYRFSLAWPRILPDGDGAINEEGLDFYDQLVDALLEAGITPWATLFHWDLPQALQQRYGGWAHSQCAQDFAHYAQVCAARLGDRVKNWFTINEIICFTTLAHQEGRHAPGNILSPVESNATVRNALLGHGQALRALKEEVPGVKVGLVENLEAVWPLYASDDHIAAGKKAFHDLNQQRLYPALKGQFNQEVYERHFGPCPPISENDLALMSPDCDFIAYNYYTARPVVAADNEQGWQEVPFPKDFPRTNMGWPITPEGLYWSLRYSGEEFPHLPIYVTENGCAAEDEPNESGYVADAGRVQYYRSHLDACLRAQEDGAPLKGYFAWSLMDNFEWSEGYSKRFGLTRVNYETQQRTIKASGRFYAECIRKGHIV